MSPTVTLLIPRQEIRLILASTMNWCLKRQSMCLWSRIRLETAVRPAVSNPRDIESLDIFRSCNTHFSSIQVKSWHHMLASSVIRGSKKANYVFTVTKSTWNCLSPGRFKPHVWVSHLTYVGRILTFGFSSIRVKSWHHILVSAMNRCSKRQSMCVWWRIRLETAVRPAVSNPTWHRVTWHIQVVYTRFLLDPSEILAPHTCKCSYLRF